MSSPLALLGLARLVLLLYAPRASHESIAVPFDETAWQRELNKAINVGVFGSNSIRALEVVAELTALQQRSGQLQRREGEEFCRFPADSAHAHRPLSMRMNYTCSGSLTTAPLQVTAASLPAADDDSSSLYVDTRSVVYDMSPESSFTSIPSIKVATVAGVRWQPTLNVSRTKLESYLQMAKKDGATIALMFEYSLLGTNGPLTIDGPEIGAMREMARRVDIIIICPFNLTLPDATSRNAAVVILQNGSLARAAVTGGTHTEKNFPVLGYFPGEIGNGMLPPCYCGTGDSPIYGRACDPKSSQPCVQLGEHGIVPSQVGVEVFDLPGIGRIAVNTCFDIYFPEAWYEAYALGAKIVFFPTDLSMPDRNADNYAKIFRYSIVGNGQPGGIYTDYGSPANDTRFLPSGDWVTDPVVTGTIDLDAQWFHENGPSQCSKVNDLCNRWPGVFELVIPGCSGHWNTSACSAQPQITIPGWHTPKDKHGSRESVFKIRSKDPSRITVKEAAKEVGLVAFRDYIFANRRGLNSLRQLGAPIPVAVPEPSATPPLFPPSAGTLVQGNVYSAAILVNSRSTGNTTNKSWAPARVLVELYGQQSQSVALVEAADIAAAQPSAETSAVLSHIEVLLVPDALNLTVSESVQTEAAVLKWVQNGGLLVVAGGALLGGQLSGVAASLDIVVTQLERSARCGTSITLSRNEKAVLATNWFSTATNLNLSTTDPGIVIHDRQAGGGVGSTETIVISKCNGGSSRKFAVARSLGTQGGWIAYTSSIDPLLQQSIANFLLLTGKGCAECSRFGSGPRPLAVVDCGDGRNYVSQRSPLAALSFLPGRRQSPGDDARFDSSKLDRYRVTLSHLDSAVACNGTSCRLCFDFLLDWFSASGSSSGYSPPTTRLVSSDVGLGSIDAMQTSGGLTVSATVLPNATLPLSFEIVAAHQPAASFRCQLDEDCELNGVCQRSSGLCACNPGWEGPSCGRLRLLPARRAGAYPTFRARHHVPLRSWPDPWDYQNTVPVSWGGSMMVDAVTGKTHGFFDTGCFMQGAAHVNGYQVVHAVSEGGPDGPFTFKEALIPQSKGWSCNPHCSHIKTPDGDPRGVYVCFLSIANPRQVMNPLPLNKTCTGAEVAGNASSRFTGQPPAATLIGNCSATRDGQIGEDGLSSTCAVYTHDLEHGPWYAKNVYANQAKASNAGVWQLKNGSVLAVYAAGGGIDCGDVPGCNSEPVKLSIAPTWDGNYTPVGPVLPGGIVSPLWSRDQFGRIMPAEDPCFFQDKRGYLHLLVHSNTWAGSWPSLHAFSRDGSYGSWKVGTGYWGSPYTTNVSWQAPVGPGTQAGIDTPGWTKFYRRERPELHLDASGAPSYLLNGVQYGLEYPEHQYSFTLIQHVNTAPK